MGPTYTPYAGLETAVLLVKTQEQGQDSSRGRPARQRCSSSRIDSQRIRVTAEAKPLKTRRASRLARPWYLQSTQRLSKVVSHTSQGGS